MRAEDTEQWYDPSSTTFGDRVTGAREQTGMSQGELAKRMGIKVQTLKSWEDDLSEPRANKLSMMAGLLNVSLSWLLTGEGNGPVAPDEDGWLSQDAVSVLTEIQELRAQLAASASRLARLDYALRDMLRPDTVE